VCTLVLADPAIPKALRRQRCEAIRIIGSLFKTLSSEQMKISRKMGRKNFDPFSDLSAGLQSP
jgi:hypothetical protein